MSPASRWEKYKVAGPTAPAPTNRWDQYRVGGTALPAPAPSVLAAPTQSLPRWAEPAINALPAVTSGIAGLAGGGEGPLAIGLAGAGGSAGEVARELLAQHFGLSTDQGVNWKNVAAQGGIGAGSQLAGGLLVKGAGAGAARFMESSLGQKAGRLATRFPTMVQEALDAGVIPGKNALKSIAGKLGESSARLNALLTRFEQAGATHGIEELTRSAGRRINQMLASGVPEMEQQGRLMWNELQKFYAKHPIGLKLDPLTVQEIKTTAKTLAEDAGLPTMKRQLHNLVAKDAKVALEALEKRFPNVVKPGELGVAARNLKTQGLMGVERALGGGGARKLASASARRGSNVAGSLLARHVALPAAGAAIGGLVPGNRSYHAAVGVALAESANVPQLAALYAHSLNNPLIQQLLAQGPRALAALAQP